MEKRILELMEVDKDAELEFFKEWFRAKYAETIRERKKGATNQDFENVSNSFHKFIREEKDRIGLNNSNDFYKILEVGLYTAFSFDMISNSCK